MRDYNFRYQRGQSMPFKTLEATSDADFFEVVLPEWEKQTGFKHVPGTVTCRVRDTYPVLEPGSNQRAA